MTGPVSEAAQRRSVVGSRVCGNADTNGWLRRRDHAELTQHPKLVDDVPPFDDLAVGDPGTAHDDESRRTLRRRKPKTVAKMSAARCQAKGHAIAFGDHLVDLDAHVGERRTKG